MIDHCAGEEKMMPREQAVEHAIEEQIDTKAFLDYAQELLTELEILSRRLELEDFADCLTTTKEAAARAPIPSKSKRASR